MPELLWELLNEPERGLRFHRSSAGEVFFSFADLLRAAAARAAALGEYGLRTGDRVVLVVADEADMAVSFLACLVAGFVPVLTAARATAKSEERFQANVAHVARSSEARAILTTTTVAAAFRPAMRNCTELQHVIEIEQLAGANADAVPMTGRQNPDDLCFLQYTSGSTAAPKGVMITHGNVIANANACVDAIQRDGEPQARGVSWLPLYHDFGLIGFFMTAVLRRVETTYFSPALFARRPALWLELIEREQATASGVPAFAMAYLQKRLRNHDMSRYDLSSLRALFCGAEPIQPNVLRAFSEFLAPAGFDPHCFLPCYGLAESTLAVTLHEARRPVRFERISVADLRRGQATPAAAGESAKELIACGRALPGHEVRIVDADGTPLPERQVGEIQTRGPSVSPGYYKDAAASARSHLDGWLATGDLGYLADAELFVCGRIKELIIVRGVNLHPHDIEWTVEQVVDVRSRTVAAFGSDFADGEGLVVIVEAAVDGDEATALRSEIEQAVTREHGIVPADIRFARLGLIPLTSSGKVQRSRLKALYEAGALDGPGTSGCSQ